MTLQNRVDPLGQLHAVPARGDFMGNRGILHNAQQHIVTQWRGKAWITCQLQFKGRQSPVFAPDSYSQLFFRDEATAFAAGHRPCAECRRGRFNEFKAAWLQVNHDLIETASPTVLSIDSILHQERLLPDKSKRCHEATLGSLPPGSMLLHNGQALLLWQGKLLAWSFDGYQRSTAALPVAARVQVLTPPSVVRVFASGLLPQVHVSAYH